MRKETVQKLLNVIAWIALLSLVALISIRIYLEDKLIGIIFALIAILFMIYRVNGQFKKDSSNKPDPR